MRCMGRLLRTVSKECCLPFGIGSSRKACGTVQTVGAPFRSAVHNFTAVNWWL